LIDYCQLLETIIHPKRKEIFSYLSPYVTKDKINENYWRKRETYSQRDLNQNQTLILTDIYSNFIGKKNSSTLLLMGEGGTGKSMSIFTWSDILLKKWWIYINDGDDHESQYPEYLPLFIRPMLSEWSYKKLSMSFLIQCN